MIPILVIITDHVVSDATAVRTADELETAFKDTIAEHGQSYSDDDLERDHVHIGNVTICRHWAQRPKDEDPWRNDPQFPPRDWEYEVGEGDTRLGYLDWVASKREEAAETAEAADTDDED